MVTVSNGVKELHYGKIYLSNVVITRKRNLFWGRKWTAIDVKMSVGILAIHLLSLFAPFTFTWGAFWAAFVTYVFCGLFGVTLTYHRILAHRSLKVPKWLEYIFAYLGVLSFQRDPIFWVSIHRFHHQYVDSEKDPHSPIFGFWFSHMGWLFDTGYIIEKYQEPLVYALGGFTYFVWTVGVATTWGYHVTFLVNSACHIWGNQMWKTNDLSKNNWWVAMVTFGEGWHNNHHAFEYSARHGLEWWQIDFCWYTIRFLEAIGLATNVKLPAKEHKKKKTL